MTLTLLHFLRFTFSVAAAVALTACAANSDSGVPAPAAAAQASVAPNASIRNDAGEYSGTVHDNIVGNGGAQASLMQDEHDVGGVLTETINNKVYTNALVATTGTGRTLVGAEAVPTPPIGSGACTFSLNATFHLKNFVLSGTYKAVHGCTGESGTFSMTEQCRYPNAGVLGAIQAWKRGGTEPDHGVTQC
jgi:hypothetical protein